MPRAEDLPATPFDVLDPTRVGGVTVPASVVSQVWGDESDLGRPQDGPDEERLRKWLRFYGHLKPNDAEVLQSRFDATLLEDQPTRLRTYRGLSHSDLINALLDTFMLGEQPGVWAAEAGGHAYQQIEHHAFQPDQRGLSRVLKGAATKSMIGDYVQALMPGWLELAAQKLGLMKSGRAIHGFGTIHEALLGIPRPDTMSRGEQDRIDKLLRMTKFGHVLMSATDAFWQAPWDILERQFALVAPEWTEKGVQKVFPHVLGQNVSEYATYEQAFFRPYLPYWSAVGGREAGLPESMVNSPERAAAWMMEHDDDPVWPLVVKAGRMLGLLNKEQADRGSRGVAGKLAQVQSWMMSPLLQAAAGTPMFMDTDRGDVTGFAADMVLDLLWFVPGGEVTKGLKALGGGVAERVAGTLNRLLAKGEGGGMQLVKQGSDWVPKHPWKHRLGQKYEQQMRQTALRLKDLLARHAHIGGAQAPVDFVTGQAAINAATDAVVARQHLRAQIVDFLAGARGEGAEAVADDLHRLLPEAAGNPAVRRDAARSLLEQINEARSLRHGPEGVSRHTIYDVGKLKSTRRGLGLRATNAARRLQGLAPLRAMEDEEVEAVAAIFDLVQEQRDAAFLFGQVHMQKTNTEIAEALAKGAGDNPRLANLRKITDAMVREGVSVDGTKEFTFGHEWIGRSPRQLQALGREVETRVARRLSDFSLPVNEAGRLSFLRNGTAEVLGPEDLLDSVKAAFPKLAEDARLGIAGKTGELNELASRLYRTIDGIVPDAEKLGKYDAWLASQTYDHPDELADLAKGLYALTHPAEIAEEIGQQWTRQMGRLESHAGPKIRKLVEETSARQTAVEETVAKMAEDSGLFPVGPNGMSFARQVLSQVHSFRAFKAYFNPKVWARDAQMFDPLLAGEMDNIAEQMRIRGMRSIGVSPADPSLERKVVTSLADRVWEGLQDTSGAITAKADMDKAVTSVADMHERLGRMRSIPSQMIGDAGMASRVANAQAMKESNAAFGWTPEQTAKYVGFSPDEAGVKEFLDVAMRKEGEDGTSWVVRMYEKYGERAGELIDRADQVFWLTRMMPNSKAYGALAGQRLPFEMAQVLLHGPGTIRRGGLKGQYLAGVNLWKMGKVILNPAAQVRNMISNMMLIFNEMGIKGINPAHAVTALSDLSRNEGSALLMKRYTNILDSTWTRREGMAGARTLDMMMEADHRFGVVGNILHGITSAFNGAYQFNEVWGKAVVFNAVYPEKLAEAARANKTGEEAIKWASEQAGRAATRTLFDYGNVPPVVNFLRGWGIIPFITFPYKALPRTFMSALENPARFGTWPKLFQAIGDLDEQRESYDRELPEWMQGGGHLRLPLTSKKGGKEEKVGYLDLTYLLPWGDSIEQGSVFSARRDPTGGGGALPIHVPLFQWAVEASTGEDYLTGKKLYDWSEWKHNKRPLEIALGRLYSFLAPPILFGSNATLDVPRSLEAHEGGLGSKLLRMGADRETYRRRIERVWVLRESVVPRSEQGTLTASILGGFFGLRARPFDLPKEQRNRIYNMRSEIEAADKRIREAKKSFGEGRISDERLMEILERESAVKQGVVEAWAEREQSSILPPSERVEGGLDW